MPMWKHGDTIQVIISRVQNVVSNILIIGAYCKVMQWDIMQLVCIAEFSDPNDNQLLTVSYTLPIY